MKTVKMDSLDRFFYLLAVLCSCGIVYIIRVIITEGVKHAFEREN